MDTLENLAKISSSNSERIPSSGVTTPINVGNKERLLSAFGGAALIAFGLSRDKKPANIGFALAGSYLLYRGASGNCPINTLTGRSTYDWKNEEVAIVESVIVNRPRVEVYDFWRNLSNLPLFMKHLDQVVEKDAIYSHWKAKIPGNLGSISWDAKITRQEPNNLIAWRSLEGSTIDNGGHVEFRDAPGNQGTEIKATIYYRAPAGQLGSSIAKLLNPVFSKLVKEDIRGFKQYLENGKLAQK
ncbi:MAG TPA: YgaP-like transmembrane domain [Cytophagales bacterium]|nr:YgaP-like transmembrane domain [Cytophagales bacterium]